jgi:hypothetical protein
LKNVSRCTKLAEEYLDKLWKNNDINLKRGTVQTTLTISRLANGNLGKEFALIFRSVVVGQENGLGNRDII